MFDLVQGTQTPFSFSGPSPRWVHQQRATEGEGGWASGKELADGWLSAEG